MMLSRKGFLLIPVTLALLLLILVPGQARGWARLDVKDWLSQPGVKLVAVEFYATWCKPCMNAVPRWQALHEKYRSQGLRLIVVSVQDQGSCAAPADWNPDQVVCDGDGVLQRAWNASELPQAFLWSWQGNLLVAGGGVEQVENAIEDWFVKVPRILVSAPVDGRGRELADHDYLKKLIRTELSRVSKFELVADQDTLGELRRLRKEGYKPTYDQKSACRLGAEVSPNSSLAVTLKSSERGERQLFLELFSIEDGCLTASSRAPVMGDDLDAAVVEAVSRLVRSLAGDLVMPGGKAPSGPVITRTKVIGEVPDDWTPAGDDLVIVQFQSNPPGALVMLDDEVLCQDTSLGCSRMVVPGNHQISMKKERYQDRVEQVNIQKAGTVAWDLEPNFGTLNVNTEPPGLDVGLNGKIVGKTPLLNYQLAPGAYEVLIDSPCFYPRGERFSLLREEAKILDLVMLPREGAVQVTATDPGGNAVEAQVTVDGRVLGTTPGTYKASICSREISMTAGDLSWGGPVKIPEREVVRVDGVLSRGGPVKPAKDGKKPMEARRKSMFGWGALGGFAFSQFISDKDSGEKTDLVPGYFAGVYLNMLLGKNMLIQTAATYMPRGGAIEGGSSGETTQSVNLAYFQMPLEFKYLLHGANLTGWSFSSGLYWALCLMDELGGVTDSEGTNLSAESFDFGVTFGGGFYMGPAPGRFALEIRGSFGLLPVFKTTDRFKTSYTNGALELLFTLQF